MYIHFMWGKPAIGLQCRPVFSDYCPNAVAEHVNTRIRIGIYIVSRPLTLPRQYALELVPDLQ